MRRDGDRTEVPAGTTGLSLFREPVSDGSAVSSKGNRAVGKPNDAVVQSGTEARDRVGDRASFELPK